MLTPPEWAEKYVSYNDDIWLHLRPDGAFLGDAQSVPVNRSNRVVQEKMAAGALAPSQFMNRTASRLAMHLNGMRTVADVVSSVAGANDSDPVLTNAMYEFVAKELQRGVATVHDHPFSTRLRVTGSTESYYPNTAHFELTYRCNCACRHCYISATSATAEPNELPGNAIERIMATMIQHGLCLVELTGGECLMHPDFWQIAEYLTSRRILYCVLTNGLLANDKVVDRLDELGLTCAQVSLDGPTAYVHDSFRQKKGSFDAALRAIELFGKKKDIVLRVAMSIWPGNYHLVDETIALVRSLGARAFACEPVNSFGRASTDADELAINREEAAIFYDSLRTNTERYGIVFMSHILPKSPVHALTRHIKNCGFGTKDVAVSPLGDVRPCLMTPSQLSLGNLNTQPYQDVFAKNACFAELVNPGEDLCLECPAWQTCTPCPLLGLRAYSRMKTKGFQSCKWGKTLNLDKVFSSLGWDAAQFVSGGCARDVCGPSLVLS